MRNTHTGDGGESWPAEAARAEDTGPAEGTARFSADGDMDPDKHRGRPASARSLNEFYTTVKVKLRIC